MGGSIKRPMKFQLHRSSILALDVYMEQDCYVVKEKGEWRLLWDHQFE